MKRIQITFLFILLVGVATPHTHAVLSQSQANPPAQFQASAAVLRGVVTSSESFRNKRGRIETRYTLQVRESLKGHLPSSLFIYLPGGTVGHESVTHGCQPNLKLGEERLFFLNRGSSGQIQMEDGPASAMPVTSSQTALEQVRLLAITSIEPSEDFTDQVASPGISIDAYEPESTGTTNLFTDRTYGYPARFLAPDRGEPIPYLVDADTLPAGMSLNTAMNAISNALDAWKSVALLDFKFEGLASFGMSAAEVNMDDGRLRLQLHDLYGEITGSTTLGIGGRSSSASPTPSGWTTGGEVWGNPFNHTTEGYVVLNHTASSMQNALTFEEVLCHELGHALGMMHSSEDANEPTSSPAYQAVMYYLVHADNRGANPRAWDVNVIQQSHPTNNSPPYLFPRMMDVVTASPQPDVPGINEVQLKGYDLQSLSPSPVVADGTSMNGSFSLTGSTLEYTATGFFDSNDRFDPAGNQYYDQIYTRCFDGTHYSPYARVRVLSYASDSRPVGISDGLPDDWMLDHFGYEDPAAIPNIGANDDYDQDTLTNKDEFRSWMDPTSFSSAQRVSATADGILTWQGKSYEIYEVLGSTNLTTWTFVRAVQATNDVPSITMSASRQPFIAYRILKVP